MARGSTRLGRHRLKAGEAEDRKHDCKRQPFAMEVVQRGEGPDLDRAIAGLREAGAAERDDNQNLNCGKKNHDAR